MQQLRIVRQAAIDYKDRMQSALYDERQIDRTDAMVTQVSARAQGWCGSLFERSRTVSTPAHVFCRHKSDRSLLPTVLARRSWCLSRRSIMSSKACQNG